MPEGNIDETVTCRDNNNQVPDRKEAVVPLNTDTERATATAQMILMTEALIERIDEFSSDFVKAPDAEVFYARPVLNHALSAGSIGLLLHDPAYAALHGLAYTPLDNWDGQPKRREIARLAENIMRIPRDYPALAT